MVSRIARTDLDFAVNRICGHKALFGLSDEERADLRGWVRENITHFFAKSLIALAEELDV